MNKNTKDGMSLKRYLFVLIALFVLLLGGSQLLFIHYIQGQMSEEVVQKSQTLSEVAMKIYQQKSPALRANTNWRIQIRSTPGEVVDLGNGYQFVTGEQTQTVTVIPPSAPDADRASLPVHLRHQDGAYALAFDEQEDAEISQHFVQFDRSGSSLERYFGGLMLLTIILCLAGLLYARWLAQHISRPLASLSKGFKRLEQGELGSHVEVNGISEVRNTLGQFNHMSDTLASLKQIENQYQQQQQLAELGDVARGLAHSFRNPLNTLGLTLEQISQSDTSPQTRTQLAEQARQKIRHLDNNIKTLMNLTSSQLQRDQLLPVNQIIQDVMMEFIVDGKQQIRFSPRQELTLRGAETELRAMLHALVSNAIEASEDDGIVEITASDDDSQCVIEVRDQGCGLSDEVKQALFQPHVTSKAEGAGMGLFIVKRISSLYYHGNVTLSDNQPRGSIARLTLQDANTGESQP